MEEFFAQQMEQLHKWQAEVVDSGLALDVLHFHTTDLSTAGSRSLEELRKTYQHQERVIDPLIGKCKDLYLLTEVQIHQKDATLAGTSLAHDTLGPVVKKQFNKSDLPGQRALRILENKRVHLEKDVPVTLDEADIKLVEEGRRGMWKLGAKEEALLERSKQKAQKRKQELEEALRRAQARLARSHLINSLSAREKGNQLQAAHYLARSGEAEPGDVENRGRQQIFTLYNHHDVSNCLVGVMGHKGAINGCVFNADGSLILTSSGDGTARLWHAKDGSAATEPMKHDGPVSGAVFNRDESLILTYSDDGTARLWHAKDGSAATEPMKHDGEVSSAMFNRDESLILTYSGDGTARLSNIQADLDFPVDHLVLLVEVFSGTRMDEVGNIHALTAGEWQERKQKYQEIAQAHWKDCQYKAQL